MVETGREGEKGKVEKGMRRGREGVGSERDEGSVRRRR